MRLLFKGRRKLANEPLWILLRNIHHSLFNNFFPGFLWRKWLVKKWLEIIAETNATWVMQHRVLHLFVYILTKTDRNEVGSMIGAFISIELIFFSYFLQTVHCSIMARTKLLIQERNQNNLFISGTSCDLSGFTQNITTSNKLNQYYFNISSSLILLQWMNNKFANELLY